MKTPTKQASNFRSTIGRIAAALAVIVLVMGGMSTITPALSANDHRDKGWHKGERDRHDNRREYQQPHYYSQPVYAPPPVYYAPEPSVGISFFFPLDFRR